MARSTSNLRYDTSLEISLIRSGPPNTGSKWIISITPHGFPDSKIITIIKPNDQQIVEFEKIIEDFINFSAKDEKIEAAILLEFMAKRIRNSIKK